MAMVALAAYLAVDHEEAMDMQFQTSLRNRTLRDASDPFLIGDNFQRFYRMDQHTAIILIDLLTPRLTNHWQGVPPHLQVLSVLRFFAEGGYQKGVANDVNHPMGQKTLHKYLHRVVDAFIGLANEYIKFPSTQEERQLVSNRFQQQCGWPGLLGALDCTLIQIHPPADHEEAYVDHNQDHSLNVQIVADMDYVIQSIRICSGSTNDQFVWDHSDIRQDMYNLRNNQEILNEEGRYYLIGDSGYTVSTVLMTPIIDAEPETPSFRFSQALRRTRCRVEQTFGIWKEVLRCLNEERSFHYKPIPSAKIILACAVLHNFMRRHGVALPILPRIVDVDVPHVIVAGNNEHRLGVAERANIIQTWFA